MVDTYVTTYRGWKIYKTVTPDAPEGVYWADGICGIYWKLSAVKKCICRSEGGTWVDGECTDVAEPEDPRIPQYVETYRGLEINYIPYFNAYVMDTGPPDYLYASGSTLPIVRAKIDEILGPVTPPPTYTCSICGATFSTPELLDYHMEHVHPPTVYTCPYCGATFSTQELLDGHIALVHVGPPPPVFTCPTCGANFATQADLDAHITAVHPEGTWPWPLNAVQNWFNTLYNKVVSTPLAAFNSFWTTHILPKLDLVEKFLNNSINWVYDQLEPIISGVATSVSNMWKDITTSISNTLTSITNKITNIGSWIWNKISPALTAITTKIMDVWSNLSTAVGGIITNITSALISIKTLIFDKLVEKAGEIITNIGTALNNVATDLWTAIGTGLDNIGTFITTSVDGLWDSLTGLAGDLLEGMATKLGEALGGFWDWMLKRLGNTAEMIFGAVNFVISKLRAGITTLLAGFLDILTDAMTPGSPPQELMIASNVLMETTWQKQIEIIDEIYKSEPSDEDLSDAAWLLQATLMAAGTALIGTGIAADLAHPLKNTGFRATTRELVYWSGIPSVTAAIATVPVAIGLLIGLRYSFMKRFTPMIPPAVDIIRFSIREVYVPERREALIQYYPGVEYQELMAKQGFKPEFAEHYWMSHWILATISQLNEMLYRGIITRDTWMTQVRYNDVIPEAIPWLEQIIYHPYTRVDIRRMWDMRTVTREQVKENYLWLGYDEEHAEMMTIWTLAYTAAADIRALYARGHINSIEAQAMFVEVGVPEERAEIFMKKLVTYVGPERIADERDLTKTDIMRMFTTGTFTKDETIGFLMDIGYSEDEAAYIVQMYEYQPLIEQKELSMSNILKSYRYEIFTREETATALIEAGWSADAAETMLKMEDIKLADAQIEKARERDLTRTDIVKGMAYGIIDVETGYNYLGYLGYSDWEVGFIFALEGIVLSEGGD